MNRHKEPPRRIDQPEVGYYLVRQRHRGPWVGAEIRYSSLIGWQAIINGDLCGRSDHDWAKADGVMHVWTGKRITAEEFKAIKRHPSPHLPIDPRTEPPPF